MVLFACPREAAQPCVNWHWAVSSRDGAGWWESGEEGGLTFPWSEEVMLSNSLRRFRALVGAEHCYALLWGSSPPSPSEGFCTHLGKPQLPQHMVLMVLWLGTGWGWHWLLGAGVATDPCQAQGAALGRKGLKMLMWGLTQRRHLRQLLPSPTVNPGAGCGVSHVKHRSRRTYCCLPQPPELDPGYK